MIFSLFPVCAAMSLCTVLMACLDIPEEPSSSQKATKLFVSVVQEGIEDSTVLKINTSKAVSLVAHVSPSVPDGEITFVWYYNDEWMEEGSTYSSSMPSLDVLPNRLVATDQEGNVIETSFSVITNAPPRILSTIIPEDSSEFFIRENQPISFKWYVSDADDEPLENTIVIDGETYDVGTLTQVSQSGFTPGTHSFHIAVRDAHGDSDVSKDILFFVYDPKEEE